MKYEVDWDYINSNKWCKDPWYNNDTNYFYRKEIEWLGIIPPIPLRVLHFTKFLNSLGKEEINFKRNYLELYIKALKANSEEEFWSILKLDPTKLMKLGSMWYYLEIQMRSKRGSKKSYRRMSLGKEKSDEFQTTITLIQKSGISTNWHYNKTVHSPNKFSKETYRRSIFPNFIKIIIRKMTPKNNHPNYYGEVSNTFIALTLSFHLNLLPIKPIYPLNELNRNINLKL